MMRQGMEITRHKQGGGEMFCTKCGHQLDQGASFCPACGQKVGGTNAGETPTGTPGTGNAQQQYQYQQTSYTNGNSEDTEDKVNWKDYLTQENLERFAPLATLLPIGLMVISIIFGLLGRIPAVGIVFFVISVILKILFTLITIGATAGLIYIAVKKKDVTSVFTWFAPFGTFLAAIACLGITFGWTIPAWICGIGALLLGLEFAARIVIENQPMDSPFNPAGVIDTYKKAYRDYKAKYATSKELEKAGIVDPENSKFDGTGLQLLGYNLLLVLVSAVTCGIATPWMICKIYRWRIGHTTINGRRLVFTGSGGSLLGHWILWELLSVITCGIYTFFAHVALRKWELKHTYIEGEPVLAESNASYFDGNSFAYFGYSLLGGILMVVTCGIAYPWVMAMLQKWDTKHQVINNRRLVFSGSGLGFLGEYIIIVLLSAITCGIYAPWGKVRMNKYIVRHTDFVS